MKLCTVCGVIASRPGSRCSQHPRLSGIGANHHVHADPRWTRLSKRMIARHVGRYGYVCPGDGPEHPAHPTRDLTLDHVLALIDGGAPFDPANTRVLCRSRNSELGARLVNARTADRGSPHAGSVLLDVREALRIFADDLTDESAARLRAAVDGPDGHEWGGLA